MSSDANNGLITKIWGPPAWEFLHCITFGYPLEPTEEQKKKYKQFFINIGDVLPCKYCRESYKNFISTGNSVLSDEVMKDRESFTRWFYNVHERVNEKLDVDYGVTYEDIVNKYESYRAKCSKTKKKEKGCITPLDKKSQSYKMAYIKDSPIIPYNLVQKFTKYAKMRGLESSEFRYLDKCKCKNDYKNIISDKCCDFWCERNRECNEIIKKMRIQGIPSLESD
ncbi:MAG: hypothetical protein GTN36_02305, partial [Candidatus Aenigmarchaeota archaeon]|nr:hypothetical protein [Candidatus Aenigmarchaeota archaeon]